MWEQLFPQGNDVQHNKGFCHHRDETIYYFEKKKDLNT